MSYRITDAVLLADRIKAEIPEATVARWQDFGWKVTVRLGDKAIVACQPPNDHIWQPEIFLTVDQVKQALGVA